MDTWREIKTINVAQGLKGMAVRAPLTDEMLGVVQQALIHPTAGELVVIIIRTPELDVCTITSTDLTIADKALRAAADALLSGREANLIAEGFFTPEDLLEALVVTDHGNLLGRVCEVHFSVETRRVYYWVVKSEWQRLLGGGFFMAGDVPHSYFPHNHRLIVPADTEGRNGGKPRAETA
jgi:hypothetical protein